MKRMACVVGLLLGLAACKDEKPQCEYTYSEWDACRSTGTRERTVISSAPADCEGMPAISEACTYAVNVYVPPRSLDPMNQIVEDTVYPRLDALLEQIVLHHEQLTLDGVNPWFSGDRFLPGKIAIAFTDSLLHRCAGGVCPTEDPEFQAALEQVREIVGWMLNTPIQDTIHASENIVQPLYFHTKYGGNQTWGMYYFMNALARLKNAGLIHEGHPEEDAASAVTDADLAVLKTQLDWRAGAPNGFVNTTTWNLTSSQPTNYYGVAFGIAMNRVAMGWETPEDGAQRIFQEAMSRFDVNSGFGYSDETTGEGRFDRYSLLVMGELTQRHIETGVTVPEQLLSWLWKSVDGQLHLLNLSGNGFEYGRSLGAYADTSFLEVLSAAAYLGLLTPEEKDLAYAFCTRDVAKYVDFWFDETLSPDTGGSVNLWRFGRGTDGYRGEFRILGENLSLTHQLLYTNAVWNRAGFEDREPMGDADFKAKLEAMDRTFLMTFAGPSTDDHVDNRPDAWKPYDRKTLVVRDGNRVISLPLINGGSSQFWNNPYYPIPYSTFMLEGVADNNWPQLLPEFTIAEADSTTTILKPLSYFKDVTAQTVDGRYTVSYRLDELAYGLNTSTQKRCTPPAPNTTLASACAAAKDPRLGAEVTYTFQSGQITRTDVYTANPANTGPLSIADITVKFGTFSSNASAEGQKVLFAPSDDVTMDAVKEIELVGLGAPSVEALAIQDPPPPAAPASIPPPLYNTNNGPLRTLVTWATGEPLTLQPGQSLTITWTLKYDPL